MNPNISPEFIAVGVWFWDTFGKDMVSGAFQAFNKQIQKQWQHFEWTLAAKKYRLQMYEIYSTMRMLGISHPVSVDGIYTDLYILTKPTALIRYDIVRLKTEQSSQGIFSNSGERKNAIELVKKQKRLFILGKPGAGKTTLSKYLTLLALKGEIDKIPIFISLNDWANRNQSLMSYIERQFEICSFPDAEFFVKEMLLKQGKAIVLFDGLDEVNEEGQLRGQISRIIEDFANEYSGNTFVITCRVAATDYSFEKFPYVEIADFTDEQVETYVNKWFGAHREKSTRFLDELSKYDNLGLQELAHTPILLNLLCLNFDETLTFPLRRAEIYQEAIDALLKKWDSSRNIRRDDIYKGISPIRKQQLLALIATEYFQKGEIYFDEESICQIIENFLKTLPDINQQNIDGEYVLKAIEAQHGILIERARRIHSFSHLSIQEYFVSKYILDNYSEMMMNKLFVHQLDVRWHEIFIMVSSSLLNADLFFYAFTRSIYELLTSNEKLKPVADYLLYLKSISPVSPANRLAIFYAGPVLTASFDKGIEKLLRKAFRLRSLLINQNLTDIRNSAKKLLSGFKTSFPSKAEYFRSFGSVGRLGLSSILDVIDPDGTISRIEILIDQVIFSAFTDAEYCTEQISFTKSIADTYIWNQMELKRVEDLIDRIIDRLQKAQDALFTIKNMLEIKNLNISWLNIRELEDYREFKDYLYSQRLMMECLRIAAVTDRNEFLNSGFISIQPD